MKTKNQRLKIGFSKIDITPKKGVPLSGTASLRPNEGILHRVFARAMVLEQSGKRHVIIGIDALGIMGELVDRLRLATQKYHVVSIICNASHTHCVPDLYNGFYDNLGDKHLCKLKKCYQNEIELKLIQLIKEACAQLSPGYLCFTNHKEAKFSVNRRRCYKGVWKLMPNFKVKTDQRVSVISAYHHNGSLMGITYSYTCHPTTFYAMNLVSGDFVGVASREIEKKTNVPALFLQGPCGDIRPATLNPENPEFFGKTSSANIDDLGGELSNAVFNSLKKRGKKIKASLESITTYAHLPLQLELSDDEILSYQKFGLPKNKSHTLEILSTYKENWFKMMLKRTGQEKQSSFVMPLVGLRISDRFVIIALGHELGSGYAKLFQKLAPKISVLTLGYSNAMVTYVMPSKVIREGGYEGDYSSYCGGLPAPLSEVSESVIVDRVKQIISRLYGL